MQRSSSSSPLSPVVPVAATPSTGVQRGTPQTDPRPGASPQDNAHEISSNEALQRRRIEDEAGSRNEDEAVSRNEDPGDPIIEIVADSSIVANRSESSGARVSRDDVHSVAEQPAGPPPGAWGPPPAQSTRPTGVIKALPGVAVFTGGGLGVLASVTALSQGPVPLALGMGVGGVVIGAMGGAVLLYRKFH